MIIISNLNALAIFYVYSTCFKWPLYAIAIVAPSSPTCNLFLSVGTSGLFLRVCASCYFSIVSVVVISGKASVCCVVYISCL